MTRLKLVTGLGLGGSLLQALTIAATQNWRGFVFGATTFAAGFMLAVYLSDKEETKAE